jgi:hypothetical protein
MFYVISLVYYEYRIVQCAEANYLLQDISNIRSRSSGSPPEIWLCSLSSSHKEIGYFDPFRSQSQLASRSPIFPCASKILWLFVYFFPQTFKILASHAGRLQSLWGVQIGGKATQLRPSATEEHKYTEMVLQVGCWEQSWPPSCAKKIIASESKEVKTGCNLI